MYLLGLCGGDDMGINLGSMKDRKEEEEDVEVFLLVGLLTACGAQQQRQLLHTMFYCLRFCFHTKKEILLMASHFSDYNSQTLLQASL